MSLTCWVTIRRWNMTPPSNAATTIADVLSITTLPVDIKPSVKDICQKRYGFYHPDLLLSVDDRIGKVTIKPNVVNFRLLLADMKDLDLRFSIWGCPFAC